MYDYRKCKQSVGSYNCFNSLEKCNELDALTAYYDNDDNEYGVDSGRIGCYPLTKDQIKEVDDNLGNVVEFEHNFTCEYDEETGIMRFDTIFIDTKPEYGA